MWPWLLHADCVCVCVCGCSHRKPWRWAERSTGVCPDGSRWTWRKPRDFSEWLKQRSDLRTPGCCLSPLVFTCGHSRGSGAASPESTLRWRVEELWRYGKGDQWTRGVPASCAADFPPICFLCWYCGRVSRSKRRRMHFWVNVFFKITPETWSFRWRPWAGSASGRTLLNLMLMYICTIRTTAQCPYIAAMCQSGSRPVNLLHTLHITLSAILVCMFVHCR